MKRAAITWLILFITAPSVTAQPTEIVVFGASGSDVGNAYIKSPSLVNYAHPPSPPNFEGRASNGPLWVDVLADLLGVERSIASLAGGKNYAFSGATTGAVSNRFPGAIDDMDAQVGTFLREQSVSGDELFVIDGWINDFAVPAPADPVAAANKIGQAVNGLAAAGARDFLISLVATTPRSMRPEIGPFNVALKSEFEQIRSTYPDVSITEFSAQPTLDRIIADPSSIGLNFLDGQACNDCRLGNPIPTDIAVHPNEYLYWDGVHFTLPVNDAIGRAAFETYNSPYLINENFNNLPSGSLPAGTTILDSNIGRPWGPSQITSEDGRIRFQTTGKVPPHDPPERAMDTGFMALSWDVSDSDPVYADGYLRTTLRADTESDANLFMRVDLTQRAGYVFTGIGAIGEFRAICFCGSGELGRIPGFEVGKDYHMETGTVGNRITMKVWEVGTEEPDLPQLVVFDNGRTTGSLGIIPGSSPTLTSKHIRVDVSYDGLRFLPSSLGDLNQDSIVDVEDIDHLTKAIAASIDHSFYDLNQDSVVNGDDRSAWVHHPQFANTYFGDANLDGVFDSGDFVTVFKFGKYESEHGAGWGEGDWNGDGQFDSGDFVIAFNDGGYGTGPRAIAAVPEPSAAPNSLILGLILLFTKPRNSST